jgi:serine/threonine protein kinase
MAPELLENKQYSTKIDVYSFGIVLWEICCRRTPYHTLKTPMAIVRHVAVEKQRPLLDLIPSACPK